MRLLLFRFGAELRVARGPFLLASAACRGVPAPSAGGPSAAKNKRRRVPFRGFPTGSGLNFQHGAIPHHPRGRARACRPDMEVGTPTSWELRRDPVELPCHSKKRPVRATARG